MDFKYEHNKTIVDKLAEYHQEKKDNDFSGIITMSYIKGHIYQIAEDLRIVMKDN